ncbi:MAG: acyl-ACP--UDP-N-acetylglucosamine O-acyltransferase, partial [Planctomycetota bacterium]
MADIHPTAVVSPEAELGAGVVIGPHAVVESGVTVGEGTRIMAGAYVCTGTTLGRENEVHMHAVLGHVPQDTHFEGGETFLETGDRNVFREMVTVHRGTQTRSTTRIGSDCFLMACSHVAHNCVVGDGAILVNGALLAGHVEIGARAFVSGNALVHQFTRVGRLAMVAGGARAARDVPPFCLMEGEGRLRNLNRVGLRRAGLGKDVIAALGRAYRDMFLSGDAPDDAAR